MMEAHHEITAEYPSATHPTNVDYNGNEIDFEEILSHIFPFPSIELGENAEFNQTPKESNALQFRTAPSSFVRQFAVQSPSSVNPTIPKNLTRLRKNGCTLLHLVCVQEDRKTATFQAEKLLNYYKPFHSPEEISDFVNQPNKEGHTALQLALNEMNKSLIKVLLENGANITTLKKGHLLSTDELFDEVLLGIYDEAVTVKKQADSENKFAWEFGWNIKAVSGHTYVKEPEKYKGIKKTAKEKEITELNETQTLALLLRKKIASKSKIFQHPLVRVFLHFKRKKFKWLLYLSMIYHIFWSVVSFVYIFCNTHILDSTTIENTTTDHRIPELCESFKMFHGDSPTEFFSSWMFYFVLLLFLFSFFKEGVQFFSFKNKLYYILQLGNMGQWLVNFTVFVVWLVNVIMRLDSRYEDSNSFLEKNYTMWEIVLPAFYIFGMFASLILVQVELGKTKLLGRHIEVFVFGFKKVATFLLAFLPLLTAFLFTFHLLLPMKPSFTPSWGLGYAKILSMMTGEVNYDDTFYGDDSDEIAFKDVLKVVVLVFTVVVVILLQNLLIALNISDTTELNNKSAVDDLEGELEEIYLMEHLMTQQWVKWLLESVLLTEDWYNCYKKTFMVSETDFRRKCSDCQCKKCNNRKWYSPFLVFLKHCGRKYPSCTGDPKKLMRLLEYEKDIQRYILKWLNEGQIHVHTATQTTVDNCTETAPGDIKM